MNSLLGTHQTAGRSDWPIIGYEGMTEEVHFSLRKGKKNSPTQRLILPRDQLVYTVGQGFES